MLIIPSIRALPPTPGHRAPAAIGSSRRRSPACLSTFHSWLRDCASDAAGNGPPGKVSSCGGTLQTYESSAGAQSEFTSPALLLLLPVGRLGWAAKFQYSIISPHNDHRNPPHLVGMERYKDYYHVDREADGLGGRKKLDLLLFPWGPDPSLAIIGIELKCGLKDEESRFRERFAADIKKWENGPEYRERWVTLYCLGITPRVAERNLVSQWAESTQHSQAIRYETITNDLPGGEIFMIWWRWTFEPHQVL